MPAARGVISLEIKRDKAKEGFLLDEPEFHAALGGFVAGAAKALGV